MQIKFTSYQPGSDTAGNENLNHFEGEKNGPGQTKKTVRDELTRAVLINDIDKVPAFPAPTWINCNKNVNFLFPIQFLVCY